MPLAGFGYLGVTRMKCGVTKVAIIVLNWNGLEDTVECLECSGGSGYRVSATARLVNSVLGQGR